MPIIDKLVKCSWFARMGRLLNAGIDMTLQNRAVMGLKKKPGTQ